MHLIFNTDWIPVQLAEDDPVGWDLLCAVWHVKK